jgi:Ca2+-binding EF-hand superfamily protein
VHFVGQFYSWLEGPFLSRVNTPELGSPPRYLQGYNRIIGPVRLRQLRVMPGTCTIPDMFVGTVDECYAPYALFTYPRVEARETFGPESDPEKWQYQSSEELDGMVSFGRFSSYGGGGYVVDLPINETLAAAAIADLRQSDWIDRATRAVFVDLSCFNANTESFLSVRLLFEFLPTGGIMPYPTLRVLRPAMYNSSSDILRAFFELAFVVYTLFYIVQESREVRSSWRQKRLQMYIADKWNILDWSVALLSFAVILLRVYVFTYTVTIRRRIEGMGESEEYINLHPLMFQLQQVQNLNSLSALLLFLKVFKFLAIVPQMNILFGTLSVAGLELLLFSLLFCIVILGFAMSFFMAFGLDVHGYRSISASLISLFQFVLGIFDYEKLYKSNRILAPALFGAFAILVILILMNIFLAIINDGFAVVSERQKQAHSLTGLFRSLFYKKVLRRQFDQMMHDIGDAATLQNTEALMAKMDANGDSYLDAGELEQLLRQTRLYEHFTVKELIQRFDSDGDGKLSGDEVVAMNDALLRKRRQVDMQLAAQLSPRTRSKVASIFAAHEVREEEGEGEEKGAGEDAAGADDRGGAGPHLGGALYTNELKAAIEEMGYEITEAQLKSLLVEFDADQSSALDLLEFTALMARMLGYRELPEEQFKLLRRVFAYVDTDGDGKLTPAELRAVVERFGLRMASSQLDGYVAEFDADGDGLIDLTEFCNLMSKLHGRLGITTNPTMVAKDLQLTTKKLEHLIRDNTLRATEALETLVAEARLDAPSAQSHAEAAAAAAAAVAAQRLAAEKMVAAGMAPAANLTGGRRGSNCSTIGRRCSVNSTTLGRRLSAKLSSKPPLEQPPQPQQQSSLPVATTIGNDSAGDGDPLPSGGGGSTSGRAGGERSRERRRERGGGGSGGGGGVSSDSPSGRSRRRDRGEAGGSREPRVRKRGAAEKSRPGRSQRGGGGFESEDLIVPLGVTASVVPSRQPVGAGDVRAPGGPAGGGTRSTPTRRTAASRSRSPGNGGRDGDRSGVGRAGRGGDRQRRSPSPSSPGVLMC